MDFVGTRNYCPDGCCIKCKIYAALFDDDDFEDNWEIDGDVVVDAGSLVMTGPARATAAALVPPSWSVTTVVDLPATGLFTVRVEYSIDYNFSVVVEPVQIGVPCGRIQLYQNSTPLGDPVPMTDIGALTNVKIVLCYSQDNEILSVAVRGLLHHAKGVTDPSTLITEDDLPHVDLITNTLEAATVTTFFIEKGKRVTDGEDYGYGYSDPEDDKCPCCGKARRGSSDDTGPCERKEVEADDPCYWTIDDDGNSIYNGGSSGVDSNCRPDHTTRIEVPFAPTGYSEKLTLFTGYTDEGHNLYYEITSASDSGETVPGRIAIGTAEDGELDSNDIAGLLPGIIMQASVCFDGTNAFARVGAETIEASYVQEGGYKVGFNGTPGNNIVIITHNIYDSKCKDCYDYDISCSICSDGFGPAAFVVSLGGFKAHDGDPTGTEIPASYVFDTGTCICKMFSGSYVAKFNPAIVDPLNGGPCVWFGGQNFLITLHTIPGFAHTVHALTCSPISEEQFADFPGYNVRPAGPPDEYLSEGIGSIGVSVFFNKEHIGGGVYKRYVNCWAMWTVSTANGVWSARYAFHKELPEGTLTSTFKCFKDIPGGFELDLRWTVNTGTFDPNSIEYQPICNWGDAFRGITQVSYDNMDLLECSVSGV